jgi:hypothetical protein
MHTQGWCMWCEQRILEYHWQVFSHWAQAQEDLVTLQSLLRAEHYGLKPIPWR